MGISNSVVPCVLVVEDDPDIRDLFATILASAGYSVRTASEGAAGLRELHAEPRPSLVLLDLMMPGMDGWEFRSRQRHDPLVAGILVIVTSAIAKTADTRVLDAVAVCPKPIDPDALLRVVETHCPRPVSEASAMT